MDPFHYGKSTMKYNGASELTSYIGLLGFVPDFQYVRVVQVWGKMINPVSVGLVTNYGQLLALRFCLGLFESGEWDILRAERRSCICRVHTRMGVIH
jgi:hypothetical protein